MKLKIVAGNVSSGRKKIGMIDFNKPLYYNR